MAQVQARALLHIFLTRQNHDYDVLSDGITGNAAILATRHSCAFPVSAAHQRRNNLGPRWSWGSYQKIQAPAGLIQRKLLTTTL